MSEPNLIPQHFFLSPKTTLKKTLVLDLDETLVHSQFLPFSIKSDIILNIGIENQIQNIHVLIRPGVQTFLKRLSKLYEIVIFTASLSKYADSLLDILDKDNYCSYRLFREHCTVIGVTYIKDLNKLGRDLKDVIIVDNSPLSYSFNKENGIPILTWFYDKIDRELFNLLPILEFLSSVNDVRDYIKDFVINDIISYENAINIIDNYSKLNKDYQCKKYIDEILFNLNNFNKKEKNNNETKNEDINYINNKEGKNGSINITISNNEINNYLYFSPIYTINNNDIKNSNINNKTIDNLNIKINNEYDKTEEIKNNKKESKDKKQIVNSKTNRTKIKDIFNKINVKGKKKIKNKDKKIKAIKFSAKNNLTKTFKLNNINNKSINYAFYLNNNNSKDCTLDSNIIDLKTIISSKKQNSPKNFRLPKTPEIEQILYNTNNTNKKTINDIIINKIIYQTGRGSSNDTKKNQIIKSHNRNNINNLKHKIYLNINHEKHKSINYTDLNFDPNLKTLKRNNLNNNLFNHTKVNISPKNNSHSKYKFSNTIRATKTFNNENLRLKYSMNNFHKKAKSNHFKIIGITEFDENNKIKKVTSYKLQIKNSNSKRNNKTQKMNITNRTIYDNNICNYSLKKYYNINDNSSKRTGLINTRKIFFNPIFTNKNNKYVTNYKDFSDYSNSLRHKKTLSFNGDIFRLHLLNRTCSSSMSKRIIRDKSNNLNHINNNINKNTIKKIKININDFQKKKLTKIKKIKEIKFINIYENPKPKSNKTEVNNNILLNKLFENGNKLRKSCRQGSILLLLLIMEQVSQTK